MAGIVYLRTDRFEVKLEGITFKAKDFETLSTLDFLFPQGKVWANPPIVGLDIMHHPRYPSIILLLLCIGVGCVILRFRAGEPLPDSILKFLGDERIRFVGFGIPEKRDIFPFEELGLTKKKVDIGYIAARHLKNDKYKRYELGELARKVLGIKRMIGLTDASSFERHEQVKCAICQLFITSVIAMALLGAKDKKKQEDSPKKGSFLKSLNSLSLLEGWFNLPKAKKQENNKSPPVEKDADLRFHTTLKEATFCDNHIDVKTKSEEKPLRNALAETKGKEESFADDFHDLGRGKDGADDSKHVGCIHAKGEENSSSNDTNKGISDDTNKNATTSTTKKTLKGILKSPSSSRTDLNKLNDSSATACKDQTTSRALLRRANSKGYNVSFKMTLPS